MRTGAKGAARIDHDGGLAGVGLLPRRPDPEPSRPCGPVERAPGVLPARLDRRHVDVCERGADCLDRALVDVEPEGERLSRLRLLEAARRELDRGRACLLCERERDADGHPDELTRHPSSKLSACAPGAVGELLEEGDTVDGEPEREPGAELVLCLLDEVIDALAGADLGDRQMRHRLREGVPVGRELREPGVRLGQQRGEPLVWLRREPDVRVELINPRELGGERREGPEMLADLRAGAEHRCPSRRRTGTGR